MQPRQDPPPTTPSLGFIGTGAISEAVIGGLIEVAGHAGPIHVSQRSEATSSALCDRYANVVAHAANQTVVDSADVLFLAVLPHQALDVLAQLEIDPDSTVLVSIVAGITVDALRTAARRPTLSVHRIIPMPPNRDGVGPIPLTPPSRLVNDLLSSIGTVIAVDDEAAFATFTGGSALMGITFEFIATAASWMTTNGVDPDAAARYASTLFHSLAAQTVPLDAAALAALPDECLTPGGLNEQVLHNLRDGGVPTALAAELDGIRARIVGD